MVKLVTRATRKEFKMPTTARSETDAQKVTWQSGHPTACDICEASITNEFIDGKTTFGPWGIMCSSCHAANGIGLGLGRGQKYRKIIEHFEKVEG